MAEKVAVSQTRRVSFSVILAFAFLAQVLSIYPLWSHESVAGEILGHYSLRYALGLFANIILLILWLALFLKRGSVAIWLSRLSLTQRLIIIVLSGVIVSIVWLLPVEDPIQQYLALNWLLITCCLMFTLDDWATQRTRVGGAIIALSLVVLFIPALITVLTDRPFSPDEAQWADYASSAYEAGGVYARTWLQEPVTISPGLGWSVAGYGWTLEHIAFDIKMGRLWNFSFYILAFVGIGAVTWRLYGRSAAALSVMFAALSRVFVPVLDYRPDHQLPAIAMLITFALLQARYSARRRLFWDFLCGLTATLSLEFHAAGIVFAFGFSLFYALEFGLNSLRQRRLVGIRPLLVFGIGALIGSGIYYGLNILPFGGLQAYLQFLVQTRWSSVRNFHFLTWPSLFEGLVILAALAYIAWRRRLADRLFLGILFCVIVGILLLDTYGYYSAFSGFYVVPVGILVVDALSDTHAFGAKSQHRLIIGLAILAMLAAQWVGTFVNWQTVKQVAQTRALPPFLYQQLDTQLLPLLHEDDVVASTHQLIWTIPYRPQLISVGSEPTAMKRWGLKAPIEVWERVKPTVIVDVANQMTIETGLRAYINEQHFITCDQFDVLGVAVTVMRQTCLPESSS